MCDSMRFELFAAVTSNAQGLRVLTFIITGVFYSPGLCLINEASVFDVGKLLCYITKCDIFKLNMGFHENVNNVFKLEYHFHTRTPFQLENVKCCTVLATKC